ncbi:MAG TPA: NUDIX hydrolase [Candidatus Saccharimonadia bacterium]|nr:NUDIX hydrolase [Candidatus Saccharimonadia bacterium]
MNKLSQLIGNALFWVLWPLIYVYLHGSSRVRVVVFSGSRVLLLKNWISNGRFSLSGGGMARGEDAKSAVVREIREELGINVDLSKLSLIKPKFLLRELGFKYFCYLYELEISVDTKMSRQKLEIAEIKWFSIDELSKKNNLTKAAKYGLAIWSKSRHLLD